MGIHSKAGTKQYIRIIPSYVFFSFALGSQPFSTKQYWKAVQRCASKTDHLPIWINTKHKITDNWFATILLKLWNNQPRPWLIPIYLNLSLFSSIFLNLLQFNSIYLIWPQFTSNYLELPKIYLNLPWLIPFYLNLSWFQTIFLK